MLILNGIIGFGVDDLLQEEHVVAECSKVMRIGGWLLIGWDQSADENVIVSGALDFPPIDPRLLEVVAARFKHEGLSHLPARVTFDDCSHVFDWFHRVN